jgi:hypothetical protein
MEMKVYVNGSADPVVLHSVALPDNSVSYYPSITFLDGDGTFVKNLQCYFDPYATSLSLLENSAVGTMVGKVYGSTIGQVKAGNIVATHLYNSYATAGSRTNGEHIDGSDPTLTVGMALSEIPNYQGYIFYYYNLAQGGALTFAQAYKHYNHREIAETFTGLVDGQVYAITVALSDMDEHTWAFTNVADPTNTTILEDAQVYSNNQLLGTITARRGYGASQLARGIFYAQPTDGVIKIEVALQFVWQMPITSSTFTTQQGVRVESITIDPGSGLEGRLGVKPPNQSSANVDHLLTFSTSPLPTFLGYRLLEKGPIRSQPNIPIAFVAANLFDITDKADAFVVEMLSMELDSYDGQTSDRRSILATVPQTEGIDGTIVFRVNYPTFIDIRNRNSLTLRNIRARILKSDLSTINVTGTSNMTLLIQGPDERP